MLTLFWDSRGPLVEHYMAKGTTVTSASHCDLLKNHLKPAIRSKRHGLLITCVLLQHDNAQPHTACATAATIEDMHFACLPHPPYSQDLAPSDYHIFWPLKEVLGATTSRPDEEIREAMHDECRHKQPKFFFFSREEASLRKVLEKLH